MERPDDRPDPCGGCPHPVHAPGKCGGFAHPPDDPWDIVPCPCDGKDG